MHAIMEINAATIRVFCDGARFGDPFEFALFIVGDEDTAIIKGLKLDDQKFTVRHRSAIMKCLIEAGFSKAVWHRWRVGPDGPERKEFCLGKDYRGGRAQRELAQREPVQREARFAFG
jgi:hypothetical protein